MRRYDRSTPDSRHSNRHVRFRIVFVCLSEMSGPMAGLSGESESDSKPKIKTTFLNTRRRRFQAMFPIVQTAEHTEGCLLHGGTEA